MMAKQEMSRFFIPPPQNGTLSEGSPPEKEKVMSAMDIFAHSAHDFVVLLGFLDQEFVVFKKLRCFLK